MTDRPPILLMLWIFTFAAATLPARAQQGQVPAAAPETPWARPDNSAGQKSDVNYRQQTTNAVQSPSSRAQKMLAAAVQTLESDRCQSVSARIRQEINLFDKQLVGSGVYLERRPGRDYLIRLELKIRLGQQLSSLVQVSDGQYLWIHRKLSDDGKLSRIDVARAVRALEKAENAPGRAVREILPGLGGLPRLLRGLHAAFRFDHLVEEGRLGQLPVWRIRGRWHNDRLIELLPDQRNGIRQGQPADLSELPAHLPDAVVVVLGQDDLFPYRIEYRRGAADGNGTNGGGRALVTMELFEVHFNAPLEVARFRYSPGDAEFTDRTEEFLQSLGGTQ